MSARASCDRERAEKLAKPSDTERLNWLEHVLRSSFLGNGIAIFPLGIEATGENAFVLQDLGDEDGSNLGDELGCSQPTLRAAIDAAMEAERNAG